MRKAKIVCTIGPASERPEVLDRLIESGMDVARLNFSHGTHDSHGRAIQAVREVADRRRVAVAIIQDLQGPRIRVGTLPAGGIEVTPNQLVRVLSAQPQSSLQAGDIPVDYANLARDVRPGARLVIDDGLIELTVNRIAGPAVECTVQTGGRITSHKGINLPGTAISEPTLTDKDRKDLLFGIEQKVDYVALSFVRSPGDVAAARELIVEWGGDVPVIAKIERPEAVECLDDILEAADGVMIARGDLGVEMGPEAVPLLQKRIIAEANRRRRLVITATQMLESMTQRPSPTRAEASDVANAVFDGTDAVMLSAETAAGRYPVEAVQFMDRIVRAAEDGLRSDTESFVTDRSEERKKDVSFPEAIGAAAASASAETGASAIVAFSESGTTGRLLSKQRPSARIIAFTPTESIRRRMALYWGVIPFTISRIVQTDERVLQVERRLKEEKLVATGDRIVIVSGAPLGQPGGTNFLKLHEVM